jgi:hypothetical protein
MSLSKLTKNCSHFSKQLSSNAYALMPLVSVLVEDTRTPKSKESCVMVRL